MMRWAHFSWLRTAAVTGTYLGAPVVPLVRAYMSGRVGLTTGRALAI
jgi:hypothetical protein